MQKQNMARNADNEFGMIVPMQQPAAMASGDTITDEQFELYKTYSY